MSAPGVGEIKRIDVRGGAMPSEVSSSRLSKLDHILNAMRDRALGPQNAAGSRFVSRFLMPVHIRSWQKGLRDLNGTGHVLEEGLVEASISRWGSGQRWRSVKDIGICASF